MYVYHSDCQKGKKWAEMYIHVCVGFTPVSRSLNVPRHYCATQLKNGVSTPHFDPEPFAQLYSFVSNDAVIKLNISFRDKRNCCFDAVKLGIVKTIGNEKNNNTLILTC